MGNKAAVFPLQLLGFEVDVVNSVQFSNHTGYAEGWEGDVLKGDQLRNLLAGLDRNGLLSEAGHILTGYIGSESFLLAVLEVIDRVRKRSPGVRYVCDPVLGDMGKFYVPKELVRVYREKVIPVADVVTPNQFEVEQLTGVRISSLDDAKQACQLLHDMGPSLVFITSCTFAETEMLIVASSRTQSGTVELWCVACPILPGHYTGTGDLCAALLLAHTADAENNLKVAMEKVVNTMHAVIKRTYKHSNGSGDVRVQELRLIQSKSDIENSPSGFEAQRLH